MSAVADRLREALAAGPKTALELGRGALGLAGPDAVVAKVAEAALRTAGVAMKDGGVWVLKGASVAEVVLTAVRGEFVATATLREGKLSDIRTRPLAALRSPGSPAVSFESLPGHLPLRALCRALDPERPFTTAAKAAADWGLSHSGGDDAAGDLSVLVAMWERAVAMAAERGIRGFDALRQFAEAPRPKLDLARFRFPTDFLSTLPETPGVYRFLDAKDEVFYVGKTTNLRQRLSSYFLVPRAPDAKWTTIVERLADVEFSICGSELEALLEEHRLIRTLPDLINVHERAHARAPRTLPDRSVWVLPAADDRMAALWPHRRGAALLRVDARLSPRGVRALASRFAKFFDSTRGTDAGELAIAESWLGAERDRVARLDPDRPDFEAHLASHLRREAFQPVAYR